MATEVHTGGMVGLVPTAEYAVKLAVAGGLPAGELHLTLCYLGDDVTGWPQQVVDAVHQAALELTNPLVSVQEAGEGDDEDGGEAAEELTEATAGLMGPLTLNVFAWSQFNPAGGPDGQEPCMVYQFDGEADYSQVATLAEAVQEEMKEAIGEAFYPQQHCRFEPHVTAGYGLAPNALSYTGPVVFDRLRVEFGDQITDLPLGGDGGFDVMAAAVTAKQRHSAKSDGDTYPGTDKFPIATKDQARNAVNLAGNSDISSTKVREWLMRRLKAKGWDDLIPGTWKSDGTLTASIDLDTEWQGAITAAATALLDRLGPVEAYRQSPLVFFTPESLAVADRVIEPPLDEGDTVTASATTDLPPAEWFEPPADLPPGTGHYVDGRRVYGRLAEWNVPHIGIDGRKVFPPRSKSGYRWFHTKSARVQGPNGPERIKIGHLTFGVGHASTDPSVGHLAAAAHYDNSKYRGAKVRMSEDQYGPVYAGALVAGMDGPRLEEFEESDTSGDWRRIMGNLELVAALCVNVGGFPKVGLSLAASGEPLALVASAKSWGQHGVIDYDTLADTIADRVIHRQAITAALTVQRDELLALLDDSPQRMAELLAEFDDTGDVDALAASAGKEVTPKDAESTARLKEYWAHGEGAAKIRWGEGGDFNRCRTHLGKYVPPGGTLDGLCANLHHDALGVWPGREHGKK